MYKKTVNYKDVDGNDVTKTCYFNLTYPEAIKILGKYTNRSLNPDDMVSEVKKIADKKDALSLIEIIEDFILSSYGIRTSTDDGVKFIKSKELREDFSNSFEYAEIFEDLFTNTEHMKEFIANVVPTKGKNVQDISTASVVS